MTDFQTRADRNYNTFKTAFADAKAHLFAVGRHLLGRDLTPAEESILLRAAVDTVTLGSHAEKACDEPFSTQEAP